MGAALALPSANTEAMQLHLEEISANIAVGAHAILIFDRAGWHTTPSLAMSENITPIWLPSRAPELNPVEYIWGYWKHHELPNFCPHDFTQLSVAARSALARMRRRPALVMAFWEQANLFPL